MKSIDIYSTVISLIFSLIVTPIILKILIRSNSIDQNYKGENIPICMGLVFIFVQTLTLFIIYTFFNKNINVLYYLISILLVGLVGLVDDLIGEKNIKGLKGHIISFFKGSPTTGSLKAAVGFLVSLLISILMSKDIIEIIVNTFLISLFINFNNLMDLRPGRSVKAFILVSILLLLTSNNDEYKFLIYSFYGMLLVYFPLDLRAKVMMGDVGSNVLGVTLGIYCAFSNDIIIKTVYLIILIIIHIITERYSLSKIIENNRFLKFLDDLGR